MLINAPAKINWALKITGVRPDGYHELDMLMQTVSLCDTMKIERAEQTRLYINGKPSEDAERDLIVRAVRALEKLTGEALPVRVDVEKRIPAKAGLGGGSSDCAATLKAVDELYDLHIRSEELARVALTLDAAVPFFLEGGLCRVRGIGERVEPLACPIAYPLLIKRVGDGLSTPEVYAQYDRMGGASAAPDIDDVLTWLRERDFTRLGSCEFNDLERPAVSLLPEIADFKRELAEHGALHAMMSGSGSAVYGVFDAEETAREVCGRTEGGLFAQTV